MGRIPTATGFMNDPEIRAMFASAALHANILRLKYLHRIMERHQAAGRHEEVDAIASVVQDWSAGKMPMPEFKEWAEETVNAYIDKYWEGDGR